MTIKKLSKKKKDAIIEKAFGKVGHGRRVPFTSLAFIWTAGEGAIDRCAALHLPVTEGEIVLAVEESLERAITIVEEGETKNPHPSAAAR